MRSLFLVVGFVDATCATKSHVCWNVYLMNVTKLFFFFTLYSLFKSSLFSFTLVYKWRRSELGASLVGCAALTVGSATFRLASVCSPCLLALISVALLLFFKMKRVKHYTGMNKLLCDSVRLRFNKIGFSSWHDCSSKPKTNISSKDKHIVRPSFHRLLFYYHFVTARLHIKQHILHG